MLDMEMIKDHLLKEGRLDETAVLTILHQAKLIMAEETNIVYTKSPVTVVGDIHGQFYDLMTVFEKGKVVITPWRSLFKHQIASGGSIEETNYLFLGDYVDRGCFGIEVVIYLMALKICHPKKLLLIRGNNETRRMTTYFSFKRECEVKYSPMVYHCCMEAFDCLPLAAVFEFMDKR